ncbi:MAG: M15 family metallopeptidase [bacterium]|nr:M15 family metallopeptidase [bacterium]
MKKILAWVGILLFLGACSYVGYRAYLHIKAQNEKIAELERSLETTEKNLAEVTQNSASLLDALSAEQQKNGFLVEQAGTFAAAVQRLTGTVTTLEKLTKTDPELLIKYSKVYFLNEHYQPEKLTLLRKDYIYNSKEEYFHARALPYLENLLSEAQGAGIPLLLVSAFRSFETQNDLKSQYKVTFGTGANKFSAEQGYSEHQLGTAVDFTTPTLGVLFEKFDTTTSYLWLTENAHKYGFILSYPQGNTYYIYEPWHWRFVGVELAGKLHTENKHFYDMDQREINDYLVKIFD